jgi:RIO-like serine/threonine protein kinase
MNDGNCMSIGGVRLQPCVAESIPEQKWHKPIICINTDRGGTKRVYKTYRYNQGPLGQYFRLLAAHEYRMLKRVQDLPLVPQNAQRDAESANTISYQFADGVPIKKRFQNRDIPDRFFFRLYQAVNELHERGVAHLDVGNSGNILVSPDGNPVLIDFGFAVPLKRLPVITRAWARKKDLMGALKLWHRYDSETMPDILRQYYDRYYKKNIYTPKRFVKAFKRYWVSDGEEMSGLGAVVGIFCALLFLVTIV